MFDCKKEMIYIIFLEDSDDFYKYSKFLDKLPDDRQERINRYKYDIDRKLCLLSDLFVRCLICNMFQVRNADLIFCKNEYGKPYLSGFPHFHYNISHTRNAIVIGVSEESIGVDIEKVQSFDMRVAERFFCLKELEYILEKNIEQEKRFFEVWTRKEAYVKWVGKGLSISLTSFDVMKKETAKIFTTMSIGDYLVSVCSKRNSDISNVIILDEKQAGQIIESVYISCFS